MTMYAELMRYLDTIPVIDTHEHLPSEKDYLQTNPDFFDLLTPYVCDIAESAGLPKGDWDQINDKQVPVRDRWELFSPWYGLLRYSTYMEAIQACCRIHFGIETLDAESVEEICRRMREEKQPGIYRKLFTEAKLEEVHTYHLYTTGEQFTDDVLDYVPTLSMMCPLNRDDLVRMADETKGPLDTFDDFEAMMDRMFAEYEAIGVKAFKFGSGYARKLDFRTPDITEAKRVFDEIRNGVSHTWESVKPLDDYIVHRSALRAREVDVPLVFHIGIHAWNRNDPRFCHAEELTDFIRAHEDTKIVLLHSGIPYTKEALMLARYYPNVHLNMTWMHIISRRMSLEAMEDYLEFLPLNKVTAFGGDYGNPYQIAGHLEIAKENVAAFLDAAGRKRGIPLEEAKRIAKMWFYDNPKGLYS